MYGPYYYITRQNLENRYFATFGHFGLVRLEIIETIEAMVNKFATPSPK